MSDDSGDQPGVEATNLRNLYKLLTAIPPLRERGTSLLNTALEDGSVRYETRAHEFASEAFAVAIIHTSAGLDALHSLYFMAVNDSDSSKIRMTVNGASGLARQSLEAAANARWLLEDMTPGILQQRGYAAVWRSTREQIAYLRCLGGDDLLAKAARDYSRLVADGRRLGLLTTRDRRGKEIPWPTVPVPGASSLTRSIPLERSVVEVAADQIGSGILTAEWLYRWASGLAHGYAWASLSQATPMASRITWVNDSPHYLGDVSARIRPDYAILNLVLMTAMRTLEEVAQTIARSSVRSRARPAEGA